MKQSTVLAALALVASFGVAAKLPPPDEAAKAKAAETAARAAWQAKVDAYKLCQAQDRVVAAYRRSGGAAAVPAPAMQPTVAGADGGGTPSVATTPALPAAVPPCADPGPFAYSPPEQKPLEASGAHSPAPTAANPPSVRAESATMAPAK